MYKNPQLRLNTSLSLWFWFACPHKMVNIHIHFLESIMSFLSLLFLPSVLVLQPSAISSWLSKLGPVRDPARLLLCPTVKNLHICIVHSEAQGSVGRERGFLLCYWALSPWIPWMDTGWFILSVVCEHTRNGAHQTNKQPLMQRWKKCLSVHTSSFLSFSPHHPEKCSLRITCYG